MPAVALPQQEDQVVQPSDFVADFVWSEEFADGSRILHSRYEGGVWSKPDTVFEDAGLNILPAVAAVSEDDMTVVWSVVNPKGIALKYSRSDRIEQSPGWRWNQGNILTEKRTVNLAPVLLAVDGNYRAFWSAHQGGDDDVLSATLNPAGWTEPRLVHAENTEIDVLPEAGFDNERRVWLRWESIGTDSVENPMVVFETSASASQRATQSALDLDSLWKESEKQFDLQPPVFFSSKSRATMYIHALTAYPIRLFRGNLLP